MDVKLDKNEIMGVIHFTWDSKKHTGLCLGALLCPLTKMVLLPDGSKKGRILHLQQWVKSVNPVRIFLFRKKESGKKLLINVLKISLRSPFPPTFSIPYLELNSLGYCYSIQGKGLKTI